MHTLICGVTMTGKTTIARSMSRALLAKNKRVAVFDPLGTETSGGDWGQGAMVFNNRDQFLDFVEHPLTVNYFIFIDEADEIFSHDMKENVWMLKKGRHWGLFFFLITQRPKMVHPTARNQCCAAFIFRLTADDMRDIGADFGHDIRHESLDRGEYLKLESGRASYSRGKLFFTKPA